MLTHRRVTHLYYINRIAFVPHPHDYHRLILKTWFAGPTRPYNIHRASLLYPSLTQYRFRNYNQAYTWLWMRVLCIQIFHNFQPYFAAIRQIDGTRNLGNPCAILDRRGNGETRSIYHSYRAFADSTCRYRLKFVVARYTARRTHGRIAIKSSAPLAPGSSVSRCDGLQIYSSRISCQKALVVTDYDDGSTDPNPLLNNDSFLVAWIMCSPFGRYLGRKGLNEARGKLRIILEKEWVGGEGRCDFRAIFPDGMAKCKHFCITHLMRELYVCYVLRIRRTMRFDGMRSEWDWERWGLEKVLTDKYAIGTGRI